MTLIDLFDIGARELAAFTGGGGKTTLLRGLAGQLAGRGDRVLVTTTTRFGRAEIGDGPVCWSLDPLAVEEALDDSSPVFVLGDAGDDKVAGYEPELIEELFSDTSAHHVLVEADGAAGRPLKVPADHEPVVPTGATLVVVVMGIDAVGRTVFEAAHRPADAARLTGLAAHEVITPEAAATILTHPAGGLKGLPDAARVVVAITKVSAASAAAAAEIGRLVSRERRIERVVTVPVDLAADRP